MTARRLLLAGALAMTSSLACAYDPGGRLPDAAAEARARGLFRELRCMVCQNQSIDDSDAPLAKDLRALVRERVAAGDSEAAIKAFLVSRYGEFVLLKPGFSAETLLLWSVPFAVLLAGACAAFVSARRRERQGEQGNLTPEETAKLDLILHDEA